MSDEIRNTTTQSTLTTIEKFNAAFNRHDVDGIMQLMTDDCIFENTNPPPDGSRFLGTVDVKAYWEKFFASNPDARFETEEMFAIEDRCICLWIYHKTKDAKPWHLRGVDVFIVKNGKVAQKLSYVKG